MTASEIFWISCTSRAPLWTSASSVGAQLKMKGYSRAASLSPFRSQVSYTLHLAFTVALGAFTPFDTQFFKTTECKHNNIMIKFYLCSRTIFKINTANKCLIFFCVHLGKWCLRKEDSIAKIPERRTKCCLRVRKPFLWTPMIICPASWPFLLSLDREELRGDTSTKISPRMLEMLLSPSALGTIWTLQQGTWTFELWKEALVQGDTK